MSPAPRAALTSGTRAARGTGTLHMTGKPLKKNTETPENCSEYPQDPSEATQKNTREPLRVRSAATLKTPTRGRFDRPGVPSAMAQEPLRIHREGWASVHTPPHFRMFYAHAFPCACTFGHAPVCFCQCGHASAQRGSSLREGPHARCKGHRYLACDLQAHQKPAHNPLGIHSGRVHPGATQGPLSSHLEDAHPRQA